MTAFFIAIFRICTTLVVMEKQQMIHDGKEVQVLDRNLSRSAMIISVIVFCRRLAVTGRPLAETRRTKGGMAGRGEASSSRVSHDRGSLHPEAALRSESVPKPNLFRPRAEETVSCCSPRHLFYFFLSRKECWNGLMNCDHFLLCPNSTLISCQCEEPHLWR